MFKKCEPHGERWDSPRLTYSAIADNPEGGQAGKGDSCGSGESGESGEKISENLGKSQKISEVQATNLCSSGDE
ncbi:hypothetical protein CGC57_04840 [Capnocytophaga sputigena]|nr:hypothetical protein CGC57_04840 [Capnocytophaga sputigena]